MTNSQPDLPKFAPDQIVVSNTHERLVRYELQAMRIPARVVDRSPELRLTLLDLAPDAVALAARDLAAEAPMGGGQPSAGGASPDLSVVLHELYRRFGEAYRGWLPTLGTNRLVNRIGAAHNIDGGENSRPRLGGAAPALRPADPGAGVRIGLADTALYVHPWLDGACGIAPASRWVADGAGDKVHYAAGHATFIAGLILQRAPGAVIEARQILDACARGESWAVAKELVRFSRSGVQVINLSIECLTADNQPPLVLRTAIDRLSSDVLVVAAAGNQGNTDDARRPIWPAAFDDVVAVAAHDTARQVPPWSAHPSLPWVDCLAPGVEVASTYLPVSSVDDSYGHLSHSCPAVYATWSGTSFSAATVSGLVAAEMTHGPGDARAALDRLVHRAEHQIEGRPCLA